MLDAEPLQHRQEHRPVSWLDLGQEVGLHGTNRRPAVRQRLSACVGQCDDPIAPVTIPVVDLRPQHRRALALAGRHIARIASDDLSRPTPCDGWDLRALMGHLIGQNHGFATAVRDGDAATTAYADRPPDADGAWREWQASAVALEAAFAAAALDRDVHLVEIRPGAAVSVAAAVGFQLLDTVVHTWDVARCLDTAFRPDDLVDAVLAVARRVPDGAARERPGAAVAPALRPQDRDCASDVGTPSPDPWVTTLEYLGRSTAWQAPPRSP